MNLCVLFQGLGEVAFTTSQHGSNSSTVPRNGAILHQQQQQQQLRCMHGTAATTASAASASTTTDGIDNSTLRALLGVLPWRQGFELEGIISNRVHCYEVCICLYLHTLH